MKTVVVQNQFLEGVADLLEDGQTVRIRIGGSSMDPFIRGGVDEVELVPYVSGDELPLWTGVFSGGRGSIWFIATVVEKEIFSVSWVMAT